jgi:hypothetical protein
MTLNCSTVVAVYFTTLHFIHHVFHAVPVLFDILKSFAAILIVLLRIERMLGSWGNKSWFAGGFAVVIRSNVSRLASR